MDSLEKEIWSEKVAHLEARQNRMEDRLEQSEMRLSQSIDSLAQAVSALSNKLDTFVQLHQKFVTNVLLIVAGIFLGKEVVLALVSRFLGP